MQPFDNLKVAWFFIRANPSLAHYAASAFPSCVPNGFFASKGFVNIAFFARLNLSVCLCG
ncbi:MAG: hypothetical protein DBX55_03335 [Verrucomicrobia bacterium]|nr:MAG: hypothetical protein DBX55_03335 [Verrucomicrobiota bacterium]